MEMSEVIRQKAILKHKLWVAINVELDAFEKAIGLTPASIGVYMTRVDTVGQEPRNILMDVDVSLGL